MSSKLLKELQIISSRNWIYRNDGEVGQNLLHVKVVGWQNDGENVRE